VPTNEGQMQCNGAISKALFAMRPSRQVTMYDRTIFSTGKQESVCSFVSDEADFCRRIAEIQNELEELKNTVKRSSGPINSRASSEYSDSHPSFLAPEANNRNGTYSPGPSSYGSPYTRSDEYRQGSIAGRFDSTVEEDLFMTYVFVPGIA
jgi:hypothetical protein